MEILFRLTLVSYLLSAFLVLSYNYLRYLPISGNRPPGFLIGRVPNTTPRTFFHQPPTYVGQTMAPRVTMPPATTAQVWNPPPNFHQLPPYLQQMELLRFYSRARPTHTQPMYPFTTEPTTSRYSSWNERRPEIIPEKSYEALRPETTTTTTTSTTTTATTTTPITTTTTKTRSTSTTTSSTTTTTTTFYPTTENAFQFSDYDPNFCPAMIYETDQLVSFRSSPGQFRSPSYYSHSNQGCNSLNFFF